MKFFKNYLNFKLKSLLKRYDFHSPMLEIGCGTGETLMFLREWDIEGIDLSEKAIKICRKKGLEAKKEDFLKNKKKYNSIICIDVLEHIKDDMEFIKHIKNSLNRKGLVFILVPSGKMMKDDIRYGHYRRYKREEIIKKLQNGGFKIEHSETFGYPLLHYTRIIMNYLLNIKLNKEENLLENTIKSSYESPFDKTFLNKIAEILNNGEIILKFLLLQNLFSNHKEGLGTIVIANRGKFK